MMQQLKVDKNHFLREIKIMLRVLVHFQPDWLTIMCLGVKATGRYSGRQIPQENIMHGVLKWIIFIRF